MTYEDILKQHVMAINTNDGIYRTLPRISSDCQCYMDTYHSYLSDRQNSNVIDRPIPAAISSYELYKERQIRLPSAC